MRLRLSVLALASFVACSGGGDGRSPVPAPVKAVSTSLPAAATTPPSSMAIATDAAGLGNQLAALEAGVRDPPTPAAHLPELGRAQLLAYRRLLRHPDWLPAVLARVPP